MYLHISFFSVIKRRKADAIPKADFIRDIVDPDKKSGRQKNEEEQREEGAPAHS